MTPSDSDTMMTALAQAQQLTLNTDQKFVVFTCDLQLYRVAVNVIWAYPYRFANVIMRLGGNAFVNEFCWFRWHPDGRKWT